MNGFGRVFRVNIFGESHGVKVGICIDGCPPGIALTEEDLLPDLMRRKSGSRGTTPRQESDLPHIVSGTYKGFTTGAPITVLFDNANTQSADYDNLKDIPRPGHADFTARHKFMGFTDPRGGGHFSGRITTGLVAAGVIAKKIIAPVVLRAELLEIGGRKDFQQVIEEAMAAKDSVGGLIECKISEVPAGLGDPFFGSVESLISQVVFAVPATKGIEFGSGFKSATMRGSEHNDAIVSATGKTSTNHAAGINGGITNGNDIVFRVAVKPTSSIGQTQHTMNLSKGEMENLLIEGRHDSCIALRIPVVIEAAAAIAMADMYLISKAWRRNEQEK